MGRNADQPGHWIPDNPDGSGWAEVDWVSAARGSRYHYRHAEPIAEAQAARPAYYQVVTRLESPEQDPHENTYYVAADGLADLIGELVWHGGAEVIWHIAPCERPPVEALVAVTVRD